MFSRPGTTFDHQLFQVCPQAFPGPEQHSVTNYLSLSRKSIFQSWKKVRSTIKSSWGSCPLFESVEPSPGLLNRDLSLLLQRQNTRRTRDQQMIIGIHPSRRPQQKHCGHDEKLWFYVLDQENLWRYGHRCYGRRGHIPLRQWPRRPRWRYLRLLQRLRQRQRLHL